MTYINKHMATTTYCYINHKAFDPAFLIARLTGGEVIINLRDLELVAIIDNANPDEVFNIIQSIDNNWWEVCDKSRVQVVRQSRSFSVGDVIQVSDEYLYCNTNGWSKISIR